MFFTCVEVTFLLFGTRKNALTVRVPMNLFLLESNKFLMFAPRTDIRVISFDTATHSNVILPLKGLRSAIALDFEINQNQVFWSDVTLDFISRSNMNGKRKHVHYLSIFSSPAKDQKVIASNSLESPTGLAVDWINEKVYWTDVGTDKIEVSNFDGSQRSVVIWSGMDRPRNIVVDPSNGYFYWTDWGTVALISKAYLDGTRASVVVNSNRSLSHSPLRDYLDINSLLLCVCARVAKNACVISPRKNNPSLYDQPPETLRVGIP